jgi:hypothetical protein
MAPGLHPRLKKPVGQRLAASALVVVYGWPGPFTGPTIAGVCWGRVEFSARALCADGAASVGVCAYLGLFDMTLGLHR